MSETWLNAAVHSATVALNGYVAYRLDRNLNGVAKKRGGGLITYINGKYAADSEELLELNRTNRDVEAQWSVIHRPHCKDVLICNVYRPPSGKLDKAISYLNECVGTLDLGKMEIFILGDLNINYKNRSSREFKKIKFFNQANGLTHLITTTTWNTDKSKSLLDLILTNSKYVSASGTLEHFISDHQPIFVVKKKSRDVRPTVEFQGRSYRNFDKSTFRKDLTNHDWGCFYSLTDVGEAWDHLLNRIILTLDAMCPVRTFKIKNYRPEWITNELVEQIKDRDYFYKKAKTDNTEDAWNIAKHLRNVTNANIRSAKKDFVVDKLNNCNADCKKFWHTIRTVIPSNKGNATHDIMLRNNGEKLEKKEVAHFINDFFINIGKVSNQGPASTGGPKNAEISEVEEPAGGWGPVV